MTFWILVDTASATKSRPILASCESFRKRALIRRQDGKVQEVISHGIGSVFCNPDFRGKGYAGRMLNELGNKLENWQQKDGQTADFTVLYSDIGKVCEKHCRIEGNKKLTDRYRNSIRDWVGRLFLRVTLH